MIKIKSITDVITNSSTEVFTFADEDSVEKLKRFIDSVLYIAGSDKTCDDLFEIRYELKRDVEEYWDPEDYWGDTNEYYESLVKSYCEAKGIPESKFSKDKLTKEEMYEFAKDVLLQNSPYSGSWSEEGPEIEGLKLIPKKKGKGEITDLSLINSIFGLGYTS